LPTTGLRATTKKKRKKTMNKYSVIAIVLAVIIGLAVGWFTKTSQSDKYVLELQKKHEIELLEQNKQAEKNIQERDKIILDLKSRRTQDSTTIVGFKYKIEKDGVVVKQKLEDLQKLNANEKVQFLLDRYNH
jgi:uncharacterized protein HemX